MLRALALSVDSPKFNPWLGHVSLDKRYICGPLHTGKQMGTDTTWVGKPMTDWHVVHGWRVGDWGEEYSQSLYVTEIENKYWPNGPAHPKNCFTLSPQMTQFVKILINI